MSAGDAREGDAITRATLAQRAAADPGASAWVGASAGSGKTKVLTDRVLTLLLGGTPPERILCLTFTRAAAAEMRNRVAHELGIWATSRDADLAEALVRLDGQPADPERLARARRLFARVLDSPGGLRIQTIHGFCQSLLSRFPLEAGVPPNLAVLVEEDARALLQEARDDVLTRARDGGDPALAAALAEVSAHVDEDRFGTLMTALIGERRRLARLLDAHGDVEGLIGALKRRLAVSETDPDVLRGRACADDAFDGSALRAAIAALAGGTATDQAHGAAIAAWLAAPDRRVEQLSTYRAVFVTNKDEPRQKLPTKNVEERFPGTQAALAAEAARLLRLDERLAAVTVFRASAALIGLGAAILETYDRAKRRTARLDYDDLVISTVRLLARSGAAAWVLYKLDGGIDHILIDEAQDTSPDQWEVVRLIAEEFFAGEGARVGGRTIFAVGDVKQSIFSFQGADPRAFEATRRHFSKRAEAAARTWRVVDLDVSFRSTEVVLAAVDAVFARTEARDGVVLADHEVRHQAARAGHGGLVELWPIARADKRPATRTEPAVDEVDDPALRLANAIARQIRHWLDERTVLPARGRPIEAGDIMVLVRRRDAFVGRLVRALKQRGIPVAGVDRMVLADQLSVMDLVALARFLLQPADDLTLAVVLKGPLIGFDDTRLEMLTADRPGDRERTLWSALRHAAQSDAAVVPAVALLSGLLARVDLLAPYELFADLLGRGRGRHAILARLGAEAEEPIDEFLQLALAYETSHAPSLQGFVRWLETGQSEIKRDLDQGRRDEVRIMTVHGAKGLQAPIVFLPDTTRLPNPDILLLWTADEELLIWSPRVATDDPVARAARAAMRLDQLREYRRLLYVAMTRAEDRLIICGWRGSKPGPAGHWHGLADAGLSGLAASAPFDLPERLGLAAGPWEGEFRRLEGPQRIAPWPGRSAVTPRVDAAPLEDWMLQPAASEPSPPRPLAPSRAAEIEPPVLAPFQADGDAKRFRRGLIVHRLLQFLPDLDPGARLAACRRFLARPVHALDDIDQATLAAEVMAVLETAEFTPLFGPASRAEAPITGRLGRYVFSGQIDRLAIDGARVLLVDYKTNRPPPRDAADVAPAYLGQMAAYRDLLREIHPGRRVEALLLWTDGPRLMALPDELLNSHAPWRR